jgi:hypothetical protein
MRNVFMAISNDPRFNSAKHYELPVYDYSGNLVSGDRLTEEGTKLLHEINEKKLKDWTNEIEWCPSTLQGRYIVAIAPDQTRHAMARAETRPTLFLSSYKALCGTEHKEYEWSLMVNTTKTTVYQTGVINCDYCLGILTFSED